MESCAFLLACTPLCAVRCALFPPRDERGCRVGTSSARVGGSQCPVVESGVEAARSSSRALHRDLCSGRVVKAIRSKMLGLHHVLQSIPLYIIHLSRIVSGSNPPSSFHLRKFTSASGQPARERQPDKAALKQLQAPSHYHHKPQHIQTMPPTTTPTSLLSSGLRPSCPSCRLTTQIRHASLLRRPKRPYTFTQMITLSDGSTYLHRTTSPAPIYRSTKDTKNNPLWNPSSQKLANVEEDEAGRLKRFRGRFGRGWDAEVVTGAEEVSLLAMVWGSFYGMKC